jgi:hypothetical protein
MFMSFIVGLRVSLAEEFAMIGPLTGIIFPGIRVHGLREL